MATAVAAAVAAITVVATTAAVAAVAATIAAAAATTTMTEGHRLVVTAQEGDTDDREENRETKNNNTVHSQILQLLTGTGKSKLPSCRPRRSHRDNRRLSVAVRPKLHDQSHPSPEQFPVVKFYGLRKM